MGFFATFSSWLDLQLTTYIGNNTARLSVGLEPAIVTLGTLYVMFWGYLQLTGKIDEPFITGLRRIMLLVMVLGGALQLWLYNAVIVDTFYNAPAQLAAVMAGAASPVATLDAVWQAGGYCGKSALGPGSVFHVGFRSFHCRRDGVDHHGTGVLLRHVSHSHLSKIALAVLLALGPLVHLPAPLRRQSQVF